MTYEEFKKIYKEYKLGTLYADDVLCEIYDKAADAIQKEARKGYVSLKKVEEVLYEHISGEVLACFIDEIKELGNE